MKFFICGCNGMAGHTISLYLQEQGHEVYGFDFRRAKSSRALLEMLLIPKP